MNVVQKFEIHTSLSPNTSWGVTLGVVVLVEHNYKNRKFHTAESLTLPARDCIKLQCDLLKHLHITHTKTQIRTRVVKK